MNKISRRSLAHWASDELMDGRPAGKVAKHLAAVLIQTNMVDQADFLTSDIIWNLEQRGTLAIAKVTSAYPLPQKLQSALSAQIKKTTKARDVVLEKTIDKSVLGGIRIETSKHVWDQTVSRKLTDLREVF